MAKLKELPYNLQAEKAVIGSMIVDRTCASDGLGMLELHDFYLNKHQDIFTAIYNLMSNQSPIDIQTITDGFRFRPLYSNL